MNENLKRTHPELFQDVPFPGQKHNATWDHSADEDMFGSPVVPFKKIVLSPSIPTPPMLIKSLLQPNPERVSLTPIQKLVNRLVVHFVVQDVQRFSVVEQPSFIALVKGLAPSCEVLSPQALAEHVDGTYERMKAHIRARLKDIATVCTTADIWSCHGRSFLGMTVHWIDSSSLKRQSAALACCRLENQYTYSQIASTMVEVHAAFGIEGKVCGIVTDNGYNFMKAYQGFPSLGEGTVNISSNVKQEKKDLPELTQEEEEDLPEFLDLHKFLTEGQSDPTVPSILLPPHHQCAAHALNLVASKDAHSFLIHGPQPLKELFQSTIAKCVALWNKSNQSIQVPEVSLQDDCVTGWNSFYQVCSRMRGVPEEILHDICDHLQLEHLHGAELKFLDEYCRIMEPVACALDILQAETKCLIGFLLPTIAALRKKLEALRVDLTLTTSLADGLLEALKRRFSSCFTDRHLVIASASIPQFRLRWMEDKTAEQAAGYLREEVASIKQSEEHQPLPQVVDEDDDDDDDDFFEFHASRPAVGKEEVLEFLTDCDKSLSCLLKYPLVKQVFITHNTPLPSSAPVERLFSLGGRVLTPSKQGLGDSSFEKLVLLRFNSFVKVAQRP
ncbi:zinc finger BED domain-containing protein 4-like isoform X2 [Ambystoma mexicanum]|uniref:zinc finger BED domain-containing protein 4-like isoform X2 n=1 Tax=Ambystoma mexicanum TaxID=8296 RepID=UPI0037E9239D